MLVFILWGWMRVRRPQLRQQRRREAEYRWAMENAVGHDSSRVPTPSLMKSSVQAYAPAGVADFISTRKAARHAFEWHERCPQKAQRIESTPATGSVVLYRN